MDQKQERPQRVSTQQPPGPCRRGQKGEYTKRFARSRKLIKPCMRVVVPRMTESACRFRPNTTTTRYKKNYVKNYCFKEKL